MRMNPGLSPNQRQHLIPLDLNMATACRTCSFSQNCDDREVSHTPKVRMAGEAMCDDLNGYTHGAYQIGKETAAAYLHAAGKGPNPKDIPALSMCDY